MSKSIDKAKMMKEPRACGKCGQRTVKPAIIDHLATRSVNGQEFQTTVPGLSVSQCSNCQAIWINEDAEDLITQAILVKAGRPLPNNAIAINEKCELSISKNESPVK